MRFLIFDLILYISIEHSYQIDNAEIDISIKYQTDISKSSNLQIIIPQKKRNIIIREQIENQESIFIEKKFAINFDYRFTNYLYFKDSLNNDFKIKISDKQFAKEDGPVLIDLSFNVKCLTNYYGDKCSTICVPFEDCNDCFDNGTLIELIDYCESDICIDHIRRSSKIKCPIKLTSTTQFTISSSTTMKTNFQNSPQSMKLEFKDNSYAKIVFEMKLLVSLITVCMIFMVIFCIAISCHFRRFSRTIHYDIEKILEENKSFISDFNSQSISDNTNNI